MILNYIGFNKSAGMSCAGILEAKQAKKKDGAICASSAKNITSALSFITHGSHR